MSANTRTERRTVGGTKSEILTVRVLPEVKDALRATAARERRSLANMLEVMIRDWCERLPADGAGTRTFRGALSRGDAND